MKKARWILGAFVLGLASGGFAQEQATVRLSNLESGMPIYWNNWGVKDVAAGDAFFVQVLGGPPGGDRSPIAIVGTTTTVFKLTEPGYFDAGVGLIPGAWPGGAVDLELRAWYGAAEYDGAVAGGRSGVWSQWSGVWDPSSGLAATGPGLQVPESVWIGKPLPEPTTLMLGVIGGMSLATNRVLKAVRAKAAAPSVATPSVSTNQTSTAAKPK